MALLPQTVQRVTLAATAAHVQGLSPEEIDTMMASINGVPAAQGPEEPSQAQEDDPELEMEAEEDPELEVEAEEEE